MLQGARKEKDNQVDDAVEQGSGEQRLEHRRFEFGHRVTASSKFDESNSRSDRRVLDEIQKLRSQRWDNDSIGNRKENKRIDLLDIQAQSQSGTELALSEGPQARTDLFGDSRRRK